MAGILVVDASRVDLISLLKVGRQSAGYDEGWTATEVIRQQCSDFGIFDGSHFAESIGQMDDVFVHDEQSAVQRVEYSLDASRWREAYPVDGIPDSRREEFEVTLDEGEAARSIIIRATDTMNNVATAVAEIKK